MGGEGERGKDAHCRIFAAGYPQFAQVCFWMWRERRPVRNSRGHSVSLFFSIECPPRRIDSMLSPARIWTHEDRHTAASAQSVCFVVAFTE